jgi:hypothetical protein
MKTYVGMSACTLDGVNSRHKVQPDTEAPVAIYNVLIQTKIKIFVQCWVYISVLEIHLVVSEAKPDGVLTDRQRPPTVHSFYVILDKNVWTGNKVGLKYGRRVLSCNYKMTIKRETSCYKKSFSFHYICHNEVKLPQYLSCKHMSGGRRCGQLHAAAALLHGKGRPILTEQEPDWAPGPV